MTQRHEGLKKMSNFLTWVWGAAFTAFVGSLIAWIWIGNPLGWQASATTAIVFAVVWMLSTATDKLLKDAEKAR